MKGQRLGGKKLGGMAGAAFLAAAVMASTLPVKPVYAASPVISDSQGYFSAPRDGGASASPDLNGPFSGWFGDGWWHERREPLNSTPSVARYLANECILAGVAALAVAALLPTPAGPVAAAALGVSQDMTMTGIAALGCTAGAAAGVASMSLVYVWEEPAAVREFAVAQAQHIQNAVATAAEAVGGAVSQPDKVLNAAVENVQWAVAGVVGGIVYGLTGGYGSSEVMVADTGKAIPAVPVTGEAAVSAVGHSWWGNKAEDKPALSSFSVADAPGLDGGFNAVATY